MEIDADEEDCVFQNDYRIDRREGPGGLSEVHLQRPLRFRIRRLQT